MYSSHLVTQGQLQSLGTYNSLIEVEYETFMFLVDSMHQSYVHDGFQFYVSLYEHVDSFSHSEHDVEVDPNWYMYYKSEGSDFVLPNELFQNTNMIGETNGSDILILPHESGDEN